MNLRFNEGKREGGGRGKGGENGPPSRGLAGAPPLCGCSHRTEAGLPPGPEPATGHSPRTPEPPSIPAVPTQSSARWSVTTCTLLTRGQPRKSGAPSPPIPVSALGPRGSAASWGGAWEAARARLRTADGTAETEGRTDRRTEDSRRTKTVGGTTDRDTNQTNTKGQAEPERQEQNDWQAARGAGQGTRQEGRGPADPHTEPGGRGRGQRPPRGPSQVGRRGPTELPRPRAPDSISPGPRRAPAEGTPLLPAETRAGTAAARRLPVGTKQGDAGSGIGVPSEGPEGEQAGHRPRKTSLQEGKRRNYSKQNRRK